MHTRITEFITNNSILNEYQFGFQKNKSTELAISTIVTKIIDSFENKEYVHCIFLDFAKAFDTVNHKILLQKLEYHGIRGKSLKWFDSYLTDRQQYTEVNNILSDVDYIKCGVPQGSVLGPLLFLLYINDISESSNLLKYFLFADDTTIFYSSKNAEENEKILNTEIDKVSEWLSANKLSLNVRKSKLLTFTSMKRHNINLTINNVPLEEVTPSIWV